MGPGPFHRMVVGVSCVLLGMSVGSDRERSLTAAEWGAQLREQTPPAIARGLLSELRASETGGVEGLDAFVQGIDRLAFVMGRLLNGDELAATLEALDAAQPSPADELVLAAFWDTYGGNRVPRRLGGRGLPNPTHTFEELSASGGPLIRAAALAATCTRPGAAQVNALGMALVRDGAHDAAIDVFATLADAYPGSQLAANAEEHIECLGGSTSSLS